MCFLSLRGPACLPPTPRHVFKTNWKNYIKGEEFQTNLGELMGPGMCICGLVSDFTIFQQ